MHIEHDIIVVTVSSVIMSYLNEFIANLELIHDILK